MLVVDVPNERRSSGVMGVPVSHREYMVFRRSLLSKRRGLLSCVRRVDPFNLRHIRVDVISLSEKGGIEGFNPFLIDDALEIVIFLGELDEGARKF